MVWGFKGGGLLGIGCYLCNWVEICSYLYPGYYRMLVIRRVGAVM